MAIIHKRLFFGLHFGLDQAVLLGVRGVLVVQRQEQIRPCGNKFFARSFRQRGQVVIVVLGIIAQQAAAAALGIDRQHGADFALHGGAFAVQQHAEAAVVGNIIAVLPGTLGHMAVAQLAKEFIVRVLAQHKVHVVHHGKVVAVQPALIGCVHLQVGIQLLYLGIGIAKIVCHRIGLFLHSGLEQLQGSRHILIPQGLHKVRNALCRFDLRICQSQQAIHRNYGIADADIIISMNHFKGHEQAGFGGALKNLGMGCASVGGKLELHASSQPKVATENCIGCNICVKHCAHDAIHLNTERKAEIDYTKCVGCGQCVALCQHDAAVVSDWDTSERLNYKIAEYSVAVLKDKPHFHISFIMNVSPECDCWNHNDAAIIPDLGMLASADPVALDKACADLVIQAPVLHSDNVLAKKHEHEDLCGCDKFHMIHPDTDWLAGLRHAEKIGLGTMDYELIKI